MEEKKYVIKPEISVELTKEDIDDIMDTAMMGVTYWCDEAEVSEYLGEWASENIALGGTIRFHDAESDDAWDLDLEKFMNGFKLWIEKGYAHDGVIVDGDGSAKAIDCGCIDTLDADCIVQLGLFGELVYG